MSERTTYRLRVHLGCKTIESRYDDRRAAIKALADAKATYAGRLGVVIKLELHRTVLITLWESKAVPNA